ncbi:MAG: TadA family conjugal transfer-associated ATPase [Propionibacteriaceae bacterium]|jgi:pilus assembly protein CpaF|nr:TadA family conjugal transfer-associated ATPase [Propionibacteriaceae bacterium]
MGDIQHDVRQQLALLGREPTATDIAEALRMTGQVVSDSAVLAIQAGITRDSVGLGILEPLLERPGVSDIVVNGADQVFVDCGAGLELTELGFADDQAVRHLAVRLAASVGRRLDDGSPYVDARLANGVRFHAVLTGIAHPGTCLSLRIPAKTDLSLLDWERTGGLDPMAGRILRRLVEARVAFLVSGGTGSGKTTLLGSLLSLIPHRERIVVVEDSQELRPNHPHVVWLEARPANAEGVGLITMTDLVRQALRMRPDRLVVGEVRGAELRDLLQALNTGHEGGCGTIHANSISDLPARLEALGALAGLNREACHAQIAAAIRVVIHVERRGPLRQVCEIGVIRPDATGRIQTAIAWQARGGLVGEGEGIAELMEVLA